MGETGYAARYAERPADERGSLYEQIGGAETIDRLVHAFYPKVYANPELRPLFPDGVDEIQAKQYLFLTQFLTNAAHRFVNASDTEEAKV